MRIAVIGAGAMGSLFSAFLSRSKEDICLLTGNKDEAAIINSKGICLDGVSGTWQARPKASSDAREIGKADLALICVKSFDTKKAVERIKPLLQENTKIMTMQNGLGNIEIISELAGEERVIGGVTSEASTLIETGRIMHCGKGESLIGTLSGKTPVEIRQIRESFNKAGLQTKASRDIKSLIWSKLIVNSGINALSAITRLPNGKLTEFEGTKRLLREAVSEAAKVAKRKRIKLVYDDPLAKAEAVCESTAQNISSMLQDILNRRRTEIDFINGAIVRIGQELGITVPTNRLLTDLVKTIESSYCSQINKK
ncbi:MAG: 2-dehydropantoate 2-reductase [Candidatus Omnitrophica bacterium]|nr:2-dehydropantoate 2-reductase [Candidatus Omnitrophota bacterium]